VGLVRKIVSKNTILDIYLFFQVQLKTRDQYKQVELSYVENQEEIDLQKDFSNFKIIEMTDNEVDKLKKNSPFVKYYEKLIGQFYKRITTGQNFNVETDKLNPFHYPSLFNIIRERLYHVPLWTGVLLNKSSRISNNPVECFFKIIKSIAFKNNRKNSLRPSEITNIIWNRTKAKYHEYYAKDDKFKISSQQIGIDSLSETWKDKKGGPRNKGYFVKDTDITKIEMQLGDDIVREMSEKSNEVEFQEIFGILFNTV
jgi:hypothetical protein